MTELCIEGGRVPGGDGLTEAVVQVADRLVASLEPCRVRAVATRRSAAGRLVPLAEADRLSRLPAAARQASAAA